MIRYIALDKCFSNFGRKFFIEDLVNTCGEAIYDYTGISDGVKRRQVFDDIRFMESSEGWSVPLEKYKEGRRVYYRYEDKKFSINNQPLNPTDIEELKNTLCVLNRFKGMPQFSWMNDMLIKIEETFKFKAKVSNVVSFEQNPYLKGLEFFTELFHAIINRQVLTINYNSAFKEISDIVIHPYHLKEYNKRWYLLGYAPTHKGGRPVIILSLDRIICIENANDEYIDNTSIDFDEHFDDVVGVTIHNGKQVESIKLKVDLNRYNYIVTKPIHHSQRVKERTADYVVIELRLIPNYELETLLLGFSDSVEIIEPLSLRTAICERARGILVKNEQKNNLCR